jgi:hypothetical protein
VQAHEQRSGRLQPEPLPKQVVDAGERERSEINPLQPWSIDSSLERRGQVAVARTADGREQRERLTGGTSNDEREDARSRAIEPLQIVDGDQDGGSERDSTEGAEGGEADRAGIGRSPNRVLPEERHLERVPLRRW